MSTFQKNANSPLSIPQMLSSLALESLPNPINIVDRNGIIVFFNQAYADLIKVDREATIGQHIFDVVPNSQLIQVMKSKQSEPINRHAYPDGRVCIGIRSPIFHNGDVIGCIGLMFFNSNNALQELAKMQATLEKQLSKYKETIEANALSQYSFDEILSDSPEMKACKNRAKQISNINLPILIHGENGTGKELFAHAIHSFSNRKLGPFVAVNCSAIAPNLFESEFFGYTKGAFSGASTTGKKGLFELANTGTIFLDEIGDMPLDLQPKLLRVLQSNQFYKVGSGKLQHCDVRIIAASNRDMNRLIEKGFFREDLYYRLSSALLIVPPLRKRQQDILPLANHFLHQFSKEYSLPLRKLTAEAEQLLLKYDWPGNVRELRNVMLQLSVFCLTNFITLKDFSSLIMNFNVSQIKEPENHQSLKKYMAIKEHEYISQMLHECQGNKTLAAQKLGIERSLLYKKLKKNTEFKSAPKDFLT